MPDNPVKAFRLQLIRRWLREIDDILEYGPYRERLGYFGQDIVTNYENGIVDQRFGYSLEESYQVLRAYRLMVEDRGIEKANAGEEWSPPDFYYFMDPDGPLCAEREHFLKRLADNSSFVFKHEGSRFLLQFGGEPVRVKHHVGLSFIHFLLKHPNQEISVVVLQASQWSPSATRQEGLNLQDEGLESDFLESRVQSSQEISPKEAQMALEWLQEQKAAGTGQTELLEIDDQIRVLETQMAGCVSGGDTQIRSKTEKDKIRKNVWRAINYAIDKRIRTNLPEMAQHFSLRLKTGFSCRYDASLRPAVAWEL